MRKILLLPFCFLLVISCNTLKHTQEAVNKGNYDEAIDLSLEKLADNKTKEKNQPYILLLQEAFDKVSRRDLERISFLAKEGNPEHLEEIYNLYEILNARQERIKPLLPLRIIATNRDASFDFVNYTDLIIEAKDRFSEYLYNKSNAVFSSSRNKLDFRKVYNDLQYLEKVNPNYRDVRSLLRKAHDYGTDYVYVVMKNRTNQVIPKRLEGDLLNFETYGLNDFWTVYSNSRNRRDAYDFTLELVFRNINITPEHVYEKEIIKEKRIKDGFEYLKDDAGNFIKDSIGNKIKVDKYKNIRCEFYRFTQTKSVQVAARVRYINNISNELKQEFPIQSEFIFENIYGEYEGDKRALDREYLDELECRIMPFPSNEQMIYDVGKDVKNKLKYIITRNKFR